MDKAKRIGILTSGGDSPGMNAAVVSVARCANEKGLQLMGIKRGYNGLLGLSDRPEDDIEYMAMETVLDIMDMRGTYLRTARCLPFLKPEVRMEAAKSLKKQGIEALVVIGGDGSYHGALELCKLGIPCIGIPGTIDNDLSYTEATLGYDTAVNVCVEAVRSIRATSRSHDRPAVVEVMGRNCGDIAMRTAIATGAEMVIVPEMEWDMLELADRLRYLIQKGNTRATLIISEHCWHKMKPFDWRKVIADSGRIIHEDDPLNSERLALVLKLLCNTESRATVIGYTQRGAIPTAYDSAFAFDAGRMAVDLLTKDVASFQNGYAIGVHDGRVYSTAFADALDENRKKFFDEDLYHLINRL
ncbi:MAG TPA: ATP-dependent 6-phosphofructokinase [Candidatus Limiplasma sp.]|nr:ATP-dependent 6-phosphofructokinase [Candidatus Limiplasma sp.]HPS80541.1 ATP-dependent 6-phosphofructokinase [Candidatus Limiplasma sp.]